MGEHSLIDITGKTKPSQEQPLSQQPNEGSSARTGKTKAPHFEQPLPQHGVLYFDHLDAELRSESVQQIEQKLDYEINRIRTNRRNNSLTWNDLYTF